MARMCPWGRLVPARWRRRDLDGCRRRRHVRGRGFRRHRRRNGRRGRGCLRCCRCLGFGVQLVAPIERCLELGVDVAATPVELGDGARLLGASALEPLPSLLDAAGRVRQLGEERRVALVEPRQQLPTPGRGERIAAVDQDPELPAGSHVCRDRAALRAHLQETALPHELREVSFEALDRVVERARRAPGHRSTPCEARSASSRRASTVASASSSGSAAAAPPTPGASAAASTTRATRDARRERRVVRATCMRGGGTGSEASGAGAAYAGP